MKTKAKLILAMSVLTAGVVAAGATGTFAWFTTNRAAQLTYSTVTATKNAGNLDAYIAGENASTGWQDYKQATSVGGAKAAASSTAATKMSDVSSKDGVNFCKPIWKTISGEGQPVSKYEKGKRGVDYSTFFFKVTNMGNSPLNVYLNIGTKILPTVADDDEDKNAALFTRIAINETTADADRAGYAKFDMPTVSKTWLIENSGASIVTDKYLPFKDSVAPDEKADSQAITADANLIHFTGELTEVSTANYSSCGDQLIGALDPANSESPTAVKTRYYFVSVWLEGTKSDGENFQNAATGSVNVDIDLTAIQTA